MATKKKKAPTTTKRKRKTLGAKVKTRKRKRSTGRKGFLGEMFSPSSFKEGGKAAVSGFLGGAIGSVIDTILPNDTNVFIRSLVHGGAIMTLGGAFKMPKMAAGYAGGYGWDVAKQIEQKLMSEMNDATYADPNSLSECPDALDEDGNHMYLADDGNFYYLEDFELGEDGEMYLAASFQDTNMYPQYVNSGMF